MNNLPDDVFENIGRFLDSESKRQCMNASRYTFNSIYRSYTHHTLRITPADVDRLENLAHILGYIKSLKPRCTSFLLVIEGFHEEWNIVERAMTLNGAGDMLSDWFGRLRVSLKDCEDWCIMGILMALKGIDIKELEIEFMGGGVGVGGGGDGDGDLGALADLMLGFEHASFRLSISDAHLPLLNNAKLMARVDNIHVSLDSPFPLEFDENELDVVNLTHLGACKQDVVLSTVRDSITVRGAENITHLCLINMPYTSAYTREHPLYQHTMPLFKSLLEVDNIKLKLEMIDIVHFVQPAVRDPGDIDYDGLQTPEYWIVLAESLPKTIVYRYITRPENGHTIPILQAIVEAGANNVELVVEDDDMYLLAKVIKDAVPTVKMYTNREYYTPSQDIDRISSQDRKTIYSRLSNRATKQAWFWLAF
jgi:hypothetical protein